MKILITGGSGLLGRELLKINNTLISPVHKELDITDRENVYRYIDNVQPDIILHCAALLDNRIMEKQAEKAIETNIIGTSNIAMACIKNNIRLVYLSTDYVYKGDRGNYKEDDEIFPFNIYSWFKLGGECSVKGVKNHLILRVSFGKSDFPYKVSFVDKWSSKDYVDRIAPMILEAALSPLTGVLNLGTERKTLFDHAKERNKDVKGIKLSESAFSTPYDTSLNLQKWMDYKSNKPSCKPHTRCRACGSDKLTKYLDLGLITLPNNLGNTMKEAKNLEKYPLQVMLCEKCSLSQLSAIVDPEVMYSYYTYRSSINAPYIQHCKNMIKPIQDNYDLYSTSFHIDVAGNDGTLLKAFQEELEHKVLNIDPAENLVAISEAQGIPALARFWNMETAKYVQNNYPSVNLITATNVFAHVDNIEEFLKACDLVLDQDGIVVIECPYISDFIETLDFGQVYMEHLSYMSLTPLSYLCDVLNLQVVDVEKQNIHGGTMRYIIASKNSIHKPTKRVKDQLMIERLKGFDDIGVYKKWSNKVNNLINDFSDKIVGLKKGGFKIAGIAASAKGTILLNSAGINTDIIDYICDDTPEKIGKFSPGSGIPIVQKQQLTKNPVDYLLILSWNFRDKLMEVARNSGFKGKFIVPIPEWEIIE